MPGRPFFCARERSGWALQLSAALKEACDRFGGGARHGRVFGVLATLTDVSLVIGPVLFLNLYAVLKAEIFAAMAVAGLPFVVLRLLLGRTKPA